MANPLRGEATIKLAGRSFKTRLGIDELEVIENETGVGVVGLGIAFNRDVMGQKLGHARFILRTAIDGVRDAKGVPVEKVTDDELIDLIMTNVADAMMQAKLALFAALVPDEKNADAPKEKASDEPKTTTDA